MSKFSTDLEKFNDIYKLPISKKPSLDNVGGLVARLKSFKAILTEELDEIDSIIDKAGRRYDPTDLGPDRSNCGFKPSFSDAEILTDLADLLGDIQVYCGSEMLKFGLPQDKILSIIMDSNFSKLGADGLPIYDERGKVQKGPEYWKPEPKIKKLIQQKMKKDII